MNAEGRHRQIQKSECSLRRGVADLTDRFARLSYYINEATQTADPRRAVATVFSIMRNASVPIGIKIPGQPNIADTLWLTVSDHKNKVYYYQVTNSPSILRAKLNELDFKAGSGPRKLQLDGNPDVAGDQTRNFKPAALFQFLAPKDCAASRAPGELAILMSSGSDGRRR